MNQNNTLAYRLIKISVIYLIIGLGFGIYMGMKTDFSLKSVHAHINLIGWLSLAMTGVIYLQKQSLLKSKLAQVHFWLHNLGLPLLLVGQALMILGYYKFLPMPIIGSFLIFIGLGSFALNLFINLKD
jgi:hypothetical protein